MFETIIHKVLSSIAGEYIQGLDSDKLKIGIFSGDVEIDNVSLNPQVIEMLELPLNLRFSKIGKLILKVPFKNIGSKPVEVYLDGLYLLLNPKNQSDWTFKDYKGLQTKISQIETFIAECVKKLAAKQVAKAKVEEANAGYVQKLTMKIIDNIQICVKNIHVRYEDTITNKYSWGFSLDKIDIFTTNKNGEKVFVDRTLSENKNESMRKLLMISNAGIYWNAKESQMISYQDDKIKVEKMAGMILREGQEKTQEPVEFLIKLSSQIKLNMNNKGDFNKPEIDVSLNVEKINLQLSQKQLQQIIMLTEFFSKYSTQRQKERKNEQQISKEEIAKQEEIFAKYLMKRLTNEKDKSLTCLSISEKSEYENSIIVLDIENLFNQAKKVVLEAQKEMKKKEMEKRKSEEKKGFFGRWFGTGSSQEEAENMLSEQDKTEIQQFVNDNFGTDVIDAPDIIRPKEYVYLIINFNLQGAGIILSNKIGDEIQSLEFSLNSIGGSLKLRENNMELDVNLDNIELNMIDYHINLNQEKKISILSPKIKNSNKPLIEFKLEQKPISRPHIDQEITVYMRSVRFDYNSRFVFRIQQFFDVKVSDQDLKEALNNKINEQIIEKQKSLEESMKGTSTLALNVKLESPILVIPFKTDGSLMNECWIVNLGDLEVRTNPEVLRENMTDVEKIYDKYDISLTQIKLSYFPQIQFYNQCVEQFEKDGNMPPTPQGLLARQNTIEDFKITLQVTIVKYPAQKKVKDPNILVKGGIDQIMLKLNPQIYKRILNIGQCFVVDDQDKNKNEQKIEKVVATKQQLLKNSIKTGIVFKRSSKLKNWEKFTAVLSGGYIYFFDNPKATVPEDYAWVKDSTITRQDENFVGFKNAFHISNRYTDLYMACDKDKNTQQWIEALEQVRTIKQMNIEDEFSDLEDAESQALKSKEKENNKGTEEEKVDYNKIQVEAHFELGKVSLQMYDEKKFQDQPFLVFQTNKLSIQYIQQMQFMSVQLGLGGMFLHDYIYEYKDGRIKDFITSKQEGDDDMQLITIKLINLEKNHPDYKNIGINLDVSFHKLIINFKPDTLAKVMLFIQTQDKDQDQQINQQMINQLENAQSMNGGEGDSIKQSQTLASTKDTSVVETQALQENQSILLQAKVCISEIKVVLINRRTKLSMADISLKQTQLVFNKKSDEILLDGTLGNLQVNDLTNYPQTIYLEDDWNKSKPQELVGLLKKQGSESLLKVQFRQLSEGSNKIQEDNNATFIKVDISSIHISYSQRPILRLLDYSLVQLLGPLSTPELYTDEELNMQQKQEMREKENQAKDPTILLKKQGRNQIIKQVLNPKGMDLHVTIQNPLISLKPNPQSEEYLEIDLGLIRIINIREKSSNRLLDCKLKQEVKQTYSENYKICIEQMQIRIIRSNKVDEMTKQFNYNVNINMALFSNELKYLYGDDIAIDNTMFMHNYVSPIIFRMSNSDYNLVMKCLFHNITYDDNCDKFMIHDWERNQEAQVIIQKKQKEEEKRLQQLNVKNQDYYKEKGGIFFQLDVESFSIFALDQKNIPFARISLNKMRVYQIIGEKMLTSLYAKTLNGSFFYFDLFKDQYVEQGLLGDLNVQRNYDKEQINDLSFLVLQSLNQPSDQVMLQQSDKFAFEEYDSVENALKNDKFQIVYELEMLANGDKVMYVLVADFKLILKTGPLLKLASFAIMDASVQPPPPVYIVEDTQEQLEMRQIRNKEIEQFQKSIGGKMLIDVKVKNVIISTPCADGANLLAIRGEFDIKVEFSQAQSLQYIKQEIQTNKSTLENAYLLNQTGMIKAILSDLEIFICNENELKNKNFKMVNKRNILLPLDLVFQKNDYLSLTSLQSQLFFNKTKMNTSLQKTSFRVSFRDITLIQNTINILLADMQEKHPTQQNQKQEQIKEEEQQQTEGQNEIQQQEKVNKQQQNVDTDQLLTDEERIKREIQEQENKIDKLAKNESQINEMIIEANFEGFQIVIINDINNAFVPVLDFNIFEMAVLFTQNNVQIKVSTIIQFSAEYYNPKVSLWEPIIEKVGFNIDYLQSEFNNPRQLITVELNQNYEIFNLTFSTQFLSVLTKTTKTVRTNIIPKNQQFETALTDVQQGNVIDMIRKQSQQDEELFQHISPYTIRNETGYTIDIETDLSSQNMNIKKPNYKEQKIYKMSLENSNENNFQVELDESQMLQVLSDSRETHVFKKNSEQVKIRVNAPNKNIDFIEQIDLDKVRNRLRPCKQNNQKQFDIITEVKLDNISLKKVLIISSPYVLRCDCEQQIKINIFNQQKELIKTVDLSKGEKYPVPVDLCSGSFSLSFASQINQQNNNLQNKLVFDKLAQNFINKAEEVVFQEEHFFLMLKVNKDLENNKKTIFSIEPPYRIKNCLPKTLLIQFINQRKITATTQQIACGKNFEVYNISQRRQAYLKINIPGLFWSNEAKVSGDKILDKILIKDINGNSSEISIHKKQAKDEQQVEGCKQFYIYCKGYMINESPYQLNVYTSKSEKTDLNKARMVGGQSKIYPEENLNRNIVLLGEETGNYLQLADTEFSKISKSANIVGVGQTQIDLYTKNIDSEPIYQTMGIDVSLKNLDYDEKIFSKVITISPRFIFVNKTGNLLEIRQKGVENKIIGIEKNSRIPLYWHNDEKSKFLNVRLIDENKDWNWSGNLNVQELGTVNFLCRNAQDKMELLFLRIDVRDDKSNIFIVIEKVQDNERPYLIQNLSQKVKIELTDYGVILNNASSDKLNDNQFYNLSWNEPFDKERKILTLISPFDGKFENYQLNLTPDHIYYQDKIMIAPIDEKDKKKIKINALYLKWSVDIDGFTKIIKFEDSSLDEAVTQKEKKQLRAKILKQQEQKRKELEKREKKEKKNKNKNKKQEENKQAIDLEQNTQQTIQTDLNENVSSETLDTEVIRLQQISVSLKSFGVSVVQNHRFSEKPKEVLYITLQGTEVIMITREDVKITQARIQLINIDSNSQYALNNPVIFTPMKFGSYLKKDSNKNFINVLIEQNLLAKNIVLYNNLTVDIDPFAVRIDEQFINVILDFLNAVGEAQYDYEEQQINSLEEYSSEEKQIEQYKQQKFKWQVCEIPPTSTPTFINQLILSNIEISLTFSAKLKTNDEMSGLSILKSIFTALGVAFANIDEAPLSLSGIKLINCFETIPGISNKLMAHYKNQAITQIFKVFGSLNVIGNPVGLFKNISTGVIDLVEKPAEGFAKGPLEGGLGIAQGAGSLLKNTMAGAFNSVNKITGSISNGISALCMDEEYLQEREKLRSKKPKHIGEGAIQGATSIVSGIAQGIAGVFLQPFQGAKKEGVLGFFKGAAKGIAGLVVKPITGVLDAASAATEGIKNTITYGDDKPNESRLRAPRIFYGKEQFYKEYIDLDAGIKVAMQLVSKGKFGNADFLQSFLIIPDKNKPDIKFILVITYDVIMLFEYAKKKKQWYIETEILQNHALKDKGIHFTTTKNIKKINKKQIYIEINEEQQKNYINEQLSYLKAQLDEEKKIKEQEK
ncbi:PH domain protein [Ichthyophthirius multifiliis]|uniref:PH domain protein n=1 Tax=Ichthyophthirius multifiliis TaxID=5932 RepID=G0QV21_ICHMU|nr:PH domain protein [Ichthyophthirius multifiliis]EGR30928.1 PH domain protein [Ichthyophthirius multifiliis]|eukprot:XP_004032515.1 PH domain protein [Ichthyophthirius multifiliis]